MTGAQTPTSKSGFAGQQGPTDDGSEFNKYSFLVQALLGKVRTLVPVKVMAIVNDGGVVPVGLLDVMPLVNQIDGVGNATPHATIFNLPYFRLQGGANAIIIDPKVGDIGFMVCADRDISSVKSTKAQANPGSKRRFDLADGIYVGGILNGVPEQYVAFSDAGVKIVDKSGNILEMNDQGTTVTDSNGNVISMAGGGVAITPKSGQPCTVNGNMVLKGNLQLQGTLESVDGEVYGGHISTSGDVTAGAGGASVGLLTHTHTQPLDSHGDTESPTAAPTGGT